MMMLDFASNITNGSAEFRARAVQIERDMHEEQLAWIAILRAQGVKAAHPDDGWVDRKRNNVHLCYPQFNDGLKVGDLMALGWPQWSSKTPQHRLVRITGRDDGVFLERWAFAPVTLPGEGEG